MKGCTLREKLPGAIKISLLKLESPDNISTFGFHLNFAFAPLSWWWGIAPTSAGQSVSLPQLDWETEPAKWKKNPKQSINQENPPNKLINKQTNQPPKNLTKRTPQKPKNKTKKNPKSLKTTTVSWSSLVYASINNFCWNSGRCFRNARTSNQRKLKAVVPKNNVTIREFQVELCHQYRHCCIPLCPFSF